MEKTTPKFWQSKLIKASIKGSFLRLDPRLLWHNPVMFIVEIVSVITTWISISNLIYGGPFLFNAHISIWLWFTVLFANFAEALAEGRGKAQAETLRRAQSPVGSRSRFMTMRSRSPAVLPRQWPTGADTARTRPRAWKCQ